MGKFGGHLSGTISTGKDTVTPEDRQRAMEAAEIATGLPGARVELPTQELATDVPMATPIIDVGGFEAEGTRPFASVSFEELESEQLAREEIARPGTESFEQSLLSVAEKNDTAVSQCMKVFDTVSKATDPNAPEIDFKGESISPYAAFGISTKVPANDFSKLKPNAVAAIIRDPARLNMAQDPTNAGSAIKPEFNHAVSLAMLDIIHSIQPSKQEVDFNQEEDIQAENEDVVSTNGNAIAQRIGSTVETLLAPSQSLDESGRSQSVGYQGTLTPEDKQVLGSAVMGSMLDMGLLEESESTTDGVKTKFYRTTPGATRKLQVTEPVIRTIIKRKRPVSLIPLGEGRYAGEAAYLQKEVTRVPLSGLAKKDIRSSTMLSGSINAMSTTPSIVIPLNLGIATSLMGDIQRVGLNHPLGSIYKMDQAYLDEQTQNAINRQIESKSIQDEAAARIEAENIQAIEVNNRLETLREAAQYSNKAFYYPHTIIGNSSRLLVSANELNYQTSRLARYIVGNPKPAIIEMNSPNQQAHKNFKAIVMRNLSENAGKVGLDVLEKEFDNETNYNNYVRMGNELLQAQQTGDYTQLSEDTRDKILHDTDEAFFVIDSLTNIALYDAAKHQGKKQFSSYVRAEFDGIQNGAIIQAYQLGLADMMAKGGLIYKDTSNILPEGDVRDHVVSFATQEFFHALIADPEIAEKIHEAVEYLIRKNKKKFIKYPIMTTIYGKGSKGHRDSAEKMWDALDNYKAYWGGDRDAFLDDMQMVYDALLQQSIGSMLEHAVINKVTTRMYIAFNRVPQIKGANGYTVQAGTRGLVETGEQRKIKTPSGRQMTITMRESTPSVTETGRNEYDKYNVGQQTINQSAVNGTQNIDAAVMQDGIVKSKKKLGNDFWMQQVFDAVILDANNIHVILPTLNASFKSINEKHNMVEEEYNALQVLGREVRNEVARRKQEGLTFDVGNGEEFNGLMHSITDMYGYYRRFADLDPNTAKDKAAAVRKKVAQILNKDHNELFVWADDVIPGRKGYIPRLESLKITPEQYQAIYALLARELAIKERWSKFRSDVAKNRAKAHPLVKISSQYI